MPRSKDIAHYPKEYLEITESAAFAGKVTVVEAPDRLTGVKIRGHYYAFIAALRRKRDVILLGQKPGTQLSSEDQTIVDLAVGSFRVMVEIAEIPDKPSYTVTWQNRDQSWQAQLLKTAQTHTDIEAPKIVVPDFLKDLAVKGGTE